MRAHIAWPVLGRGPAHHRRVLSQWRIAFAGFRDICPIALHVLEASSSKVTDQSIAPGAHLASILQLLVARLVTDVSQIQTRRSAALYVSVKPGILDQMEAIAPHACRVSSRVLKARKLVPCALGANTLKQSQLQGVSAVHTQRTLPRVARLPSTAPVMWAIPDTTDKNAAHVEKGHIKAKMVLRCAFYVCQANTQRSGQPGQRQRAKNVRSIPLLGLAVVIARAMLDILDAMVVLAMRVRLVLSSL